MRIPQRVRVSFCVITPCLVGLFLAGCVAPAGDDAPPGSGGSTESGGSKGSNGTGGKSASGGSTASGGTTGSGGVTVTATGGKTSSGGAIGSGGVKGSGGVTGTSSGGTTPTTGSGGITSGGSGGSIGASGGIIGTGARGGAMGSGGARGGSTGTGSGGSSATTGGAGGGGDVNCDASVPTGGTVHSSSNASGTAAGLSWTIWSNGSGGSITTYPTPAFSAAWNNSGDFLARTGLQWNDTKTYDQYGTISAQFAEKRTGSGGGYSYIGIYGWSTNPCVEFYIVDDSFNTMPVNPGNTTNKGTVDIDGGSYILYSRATTGTGGSKCSGVSNWTQFYSVRKTARKCGTISISEHFKAWAAAGMTLGKMDQAQILIEVGGGNGSIDFSTANVTTSM